MRSRYRSILKSLQQRLDPLQRSWLTVTGSEFVRLLFGLIASILIARTFGPALFSIYAVLGAISGIAGIIAEFGLTDSATKRVASAWFRDDLAIARERGQVFFWSRMGVTILSVTPGILLATPISYLAFGSSHNANLIVLTLLGVVATGLSNSITALLQASGHFRRMVTVTLTNAILTTLLAALLVLTGTMTLVNAIVVLGIGTSLVSFAVGYFLLPLPFTLGMPNINVFTNELRPLFRFGFWLWIANILGGLTVYLDVFLVNRLLPPAVVGAYALALNLSAKVEIVNRAQWTVLTPTASALNSKQAIQAYVRREFTRSAGIALLTIPAALLIGPFVTLVYGTDYAMTPGWFRLLMGVVTFEILTLPMLLLAYTFDRPMLLTLSNAIQVTVLIIAALVFIPQHGAVGAILARFIAKAIGTLFALLTILRLYRRTTSSAEFH